MTQNCDAVKAENRGTILGGVAQFCWQNGWFLLKANRGAICTGVARFVDKDAVPWVIRFNRGAILTGVARF
jgi:hypothetical protein